MRLAPHMPNLREVGAGIRIFGCFLSRTANLMCGMPDYATYAEHRRTHHPGEPIMSRETFFRERQQARYSDRSGRGFRCC
jgi:uncharacterized short protein YbdD (DUF466 family)